jgi:prolipoprotein diacylglyceryltransferase
MSSLIRVLFRRGHGLCCADMLSTLIPYPQLPSLPLIDDSLAIHPFGVLVATGILVGAWLTIRRGKFLGPRRREGQEHDLLVGALRLFGVAFLGRADLPEASRRREPMLRALADPRSGLSSMGGFAGAVLGLFVWCRRNGERVMPYADSLAYGLATGWFFGRMGCYVAHDHPGELMATSDPLYFLGVDYPCPMRRTVRRRAASLVHIGSEFRRHDMGFEEATVCSGAGRWLPVVGDLQAAAGCVCGLDRDAVWPDSLCDRSTSSP